jgi:sulfatase modifying factor 1
LSYIGQFSTGSAKEKKNYWLSYQVLNPVITQIAGSNGTTITTIALARNPGNRHEVSVVHFESFTGSDSQLAVSRVGGPKKIVMPRILNGNGYAMTTDFRSDYLYSSQGVFTFSSAATLAANHGGKTFSAVVSGFENDFKNKNLAVWDSKKLPGLVLPPAPLNPSMVSVSGNASPDNPDGEDAVKDFLLGKFEVTLDEWRSLREWALKKNYPDLILGSGNGGNHPVRNVGWYDVVKWCNALSEQNGLDPVYYVNGNVYRKGDFGPYGSAVVQANRQANGYRLPTEMEWGWAARGGSFNMELNFSGGNTLEDVGWFIKNSGGGTRPVGLKLANELGLHDMSGNVWEWCEDLFEYMKEDRKFLRTLLGGGWNTREVDVSLKWGGTSLNTTPNGRSNEYGFRLARGLIPKN